MWQVAPVGDRAILVTVAEEPGPQASAEVRALDAAIAAADVEGVEEVVPALVNLMILFDPLVTDHEAVAGAVAGLPREAATPAAPGRRRVVDVSYDTSPGSDLSVVAAGAGISPEAAAQAHLAGEYRVAMGGFAPGYAYLDGVPAPIRRPRKPAAVRGVAAGSVIITGRQCLVTTLTMPTGWWVIGRSPTQILRPDDPEEPFLLALGDEVVFRRV